MCARVVFARQVAIAVMCLCLITSACSLPCLAQGASDTVTDVIIGHGNKGPYALSWTGFDPATMRVVVNGMTLKQRDNYVADPTKGAISFHSTVLNDTIVRVTYSVASRNAKRNPKTVNVPVTLNVFQSQDAKIDVSGLYTQDDPNNPDGGKALVGLGGERNWANSKVTTQVYVTQRNRSGNADGPGVWDRAAFRVGAENTMGRFKFSGSMLQSGQAFEGGKETGFGVGRRASDFGVSFAANPNLSAGARMQQSEDMVSGNRSSLIEQSVSATLKPGTNVALSHSTSETSTSAADSTRTVDSTGLRFDTKLSPDTTAAVTAGLSTTTAGGNSETLLTQSAAVNSRIGSGQVNLSQRSFGDQGREQTYAFGGQLRPTNWGGLALTAALQATDSTVNGETSKTDLGVQFSPGKNTQIQARMQTNQSDSAEQFQRDVSIVSSPLSFARLTASYSEKGVNESSDVTQQAGLEVTPLSFARLTASYSQRGVNDNTDVTQQAGLEVTPFSHTRITAAIRQDRNALSARMVTDYGAQTSPVKFVTFSGSLRQREATALDLPDSAAMQIALSPAKFVAFTGAYQTNPEDKHGQIQAYNAADLGLRMQLGSVGVTTNYKSKNEYLSQRMSDEGRLGLELPVFGAGRLTTGVAVTRQLDGSTLSSNTYQLGYSQAMGSAFSFSLSAYYTQYLMNRSALPDRTEYNAEASLGIKF